MNITDYSVRQEIEFLSHFLKNTIKNSEEERYLLQLLYTKIEHLLVRNIDSSEPDDFSLTFNKPENYKPYKTTGIEKLKHQVSDNIGDDIIFSCIPSDDNIDEYYDPWGKDGVFEQSHNNIEKLKHQDSDNNYENSN